MTNDNMSTSEQNIAKLQHQVTLTNVIVEKIDVTIEKLTEVSARVSEILAVQGFRLDGQEKVTEQLQELIEKRRVEAEENIRLVHAKIDGINTTLNNEIKTSNDKVMNEIKEMRTENNAHNAETKKQIETMEKWMWTCAGAIGVIVFLFEMFAK